MLRKYILLCFFISSISHALVTIQASSLSCSMPTILNESAIIELDIALEIIGMCELITAGPGFGSTDTVTFNPTAAQTITIKSNVVVSPIGIITVANPGVWDVRSFNQSSQKFIFNNITINMNPGGSILADGVTFQLNGQSQLITNPVTQPS